MPTFCVLAFITFQSVFALSPKDFNWHLKEEKQGVKIFKANRHEKTGIIPIKAQTTFEAPLTKVLTIMAETNRKKEWIPSLLEARIIEKISKYERIEYARYSAPWPLKDRSFVIKTKGRYIEKDKTVFIDIHSVKHPNVPFNDEHIRGHTYIGSVSLREIDKNKTWYEITLLTDFKGSIPTWIINLVQAKWPYKMFRRMKEQLAKNDIQISPEFASIIP